MNHLVVLLLFALACGFATILVWLAGWLALPALGVAAVVLFGTFGWMERRRVRRDLERQTRKLEALERAVASYEP